MLNNKLFFDRMEVNGLSGSESLEISGGDSPAYDLGVWCGTKAVEGWRRFDLWWRYGV
jgi:hypothetical protein